VRAIELPHKEIAVLSLSDAEYHHALRHAESNTRRNRCGYPERVWIFWSSLKRHDFGLLRA